jgi:hypothetical protein
MCKTQGWMAITEKINTQQQQQKRKRFSPKLRENPLKNIAKDEMASRIYNETLKPNREQTTNL